MKKVIRQKTLLGSMLGMTLLADLTHAHQFSTTDLRDMAMTSSSLQTIAIQVNAPLSIQDKEKIYAGGAESIVYVGDLNYYIYGDISGMGSLFDSIDKIVDVKAIVAKDKVSADVEEEIQALEELGSTTRQEFNILLLQDLSKEELEAYFDRAGIVVSVSHVTEGLKSAKIRMDLKDYDKVKALPLIQYMDKSHHVSLWAKSTRNAKSITYENIAPLWSDAYHLHGEGIRVAVVDGGFVRKTHQEFVEAGTSRVHLKGSGGDFADHATHVAGTIGADGDDAKAHGVANRSSLYSYTYLENSFADSVLNIYRNDGILLSNHSYGYSEASKLGEYDSEAAKQDRAISGNPFLNIFEAAGNDGEDSSYPTFGKIKGPGNSKNILTIGALNANASGVARFSSNGPTRDGRIKPELCARGESVYSTGSGADDDYFWMNGTSMATPSVTGIGVLAEQAYRKVSGGYDIRHDILKACMINAAIDKGRKGPDFDAGFGMVNALGTIDTINSLMSSKPLLFADSIRHGESKRIEFKMPTSGSFKATISWIDPEASPSAQKALVNDLDMWLENRDGKKFYPYTLDAAHPLDVAVSNKPNHVDNNEQIEVKYLPAGSYTLVIKGTLVVTEKQEFAVASNVSISKESHLDVLQPSKLHNFAKVIQQAIY